MILILSFDFNWQMTYKVISWVFEWHVFEWHEMEISKFDWSIETRVYDHGTIGRSYPIESCEIIINN